MTQIISLYKIHELCLKVDLSTEYPHTNTTSTPASVINTGKHFTCMVLLSCGMCFALNSYTEIRSQTFLMITSKRYFMFCVCLKDKKGSRFFFSSGMLVFVLNLHLNYIIGYPHKLVFPYYKMSNFISL